MKTREEFAKVLFDQLLKHDFTLKIFFIASLNILLPLVWPLIGISLLMLIDLYTAYQASKREGIPFNSKGLGNTIKKWVEFLIGIIVTTIIDLLAVLILNIDLHFFTNILIMITALRELKSISENFAGLSLTSATKVFIKFIGSKSKLYEIIDQELESEKKKIIKKQEHIEKLKKND